MTARRIMSLIALTAVLAGCAMTPAPRTAGDGGNPLITNPEGTVDTTHGAVGAQTSPR